MIARRKRMLTVFLNRLGRHPILSEERVFQRFLEPNVPWSEVLHTPPVTLLPKNILKASARTPADPSTSALYAHLPGPSSATASAAGSASGYGQALQNPDQRFLDSELFTNRFSAHISGSMEKINRRLMKRWSELSADYAELGAVMNGFSLNEGSSSGGSTSALASLQGEQERHAVDTLARAIESTGQAIDSTYLNSNAMVSEREGMRRVGDKEQPRGPGARWLGNLARPEGRASVLTCSAHFQIFSILPTPSLAAPGMGTLVHGAPRRVLAV